MEWGIRDALEMADMEQKMAGDTESVVITILSALLGGGVVSSVVTYLLETRREERAVKRAKLEELYDSYDSFSRGLLKVYRALKSFADAEIDKKTFFERCHGSIEKGQVLPEHRIELLINVHFPALGMHFKSLLFARSKFDKILNNLPSIIEDEEYFKNAVAETYRLYLEKDKETREAILRTKVSGAIVQRLLPWLFR